MYNATSTKCQKVMLNSTLCSFSSQMQVCYITVSSFGRLLTSKPV